MNLPLSFLIVLTCYTTASAAVVFNVQESSQKDFSDTGFSPADGGDLANAGQSSLASVDEPRTSGISNLERVNDGVTGLSIRDGDSNIQIQPGDSFTYNFDTSVNTSGYDIERVVTIAGGHTRAAQGYDVTVTFMDDTTERVISSDDADGVVFGTKPGGTDDTSYYSNLLSGWSVVNISNDDTGIVASGVKSITFHNFKGANRNASSDVVFYREFDVIGKATQVTDVIPSEERVSIPELKAFALLIGLCCFTWRLVSRPSRSAVV